ncbi:hypothetical protein ACH494_35260, partial [Micromonospora fulviviridis]
WHPPADTDADAGGQPSDSAEYYDPYGLGPEFVDLAWAADPFGEADPFAGMDMSTPAPNSGWAPQGFDKQVVDAIARLTLSAYNVEKQFGTWVRDVFDTSRAEAEQGHNAFYRSLLDTQKVSAAGIKTVAGLRVLAVRQLAEEFAQGEQSTLREFLPYPEGVSEQQRKALHGVWLDKLSNALSRDYELAHVIPHLMAKALSMSMRIHHPFDAPQDIGPTPVAGAVRHHVVFWNEAYHRVEPRDPADPRLDHGFQQTVVSANEKERLDALFNGMINLLEQQIAAVANPTSRHGHILQHVFRRNLAGIRKQPVSLSSQARELSVYRLYLNSLHEDSGRWQDESPRLVSSFTLRLTASEETNARYRAQLKIWVAGKSATMNAAQLVTPGDMVSIDFGKVGEEGVGIARILYTTADGTESFIYREFDRRFTDSELVELRKRASGQAWEFRKPVFSDSFRMKTKLSSPGQLNLSFRQGDEAGATKRVHIGRANIPDDMKDVVLEVGYDINSQPLAVVEIPDERNERQALYRRLTDPAPTAYDIEWQRKNSFWELADRWALADKVSFDATLGIDARMPKPIAFRVSGPGKTVDGLEVDLSAGTAITLRVGMRLVGPDYASNVFVVVKAPLKPLDDAAKAAYLEANPSVSEVPTHAYRLVNTGKTDAEADALIEQLQARKEMLAKRRERAAAGPAAKRRRTGGSSLPGGSAAFEWVGAASADGGVGSSSGWAAGVEPSVVRVDGGWRVSYRSAEGLRSWGEMTRVESDRFTWRGRAPLEFVPTPEGDRPFRVVTAGEDAGVRVHVDHWVHRESGDVVFRLRLEPDANVGRDSILRTLRAVEQWVARTNELVGEERIAVPQRLRPGGGSQAVAVVFDPGAETVVRLSRYGRDLEDSHNVYVSVDGTEGRITQLHWLADLPSRAYGHELKHFAGVPHDGSPGDLLRTSRTVGDDHLNEAGFTVWELEQIRETAASYVAPTVAPRPAGSPESDSASSGSGSVSSERVSGSLPGRPAAMEWHPPADADADAGGQPSDSAEYYDPFDLGPEFVDLAWAADPFGEADPFAGMDMSTPAIALEGAPRSFDEEVIAATTRLARSAYHVEAKFGTWVLDVFDTSRAAAEQAPNAFYRSLLDTPKVSAEGITTVAGLRVLAARQLAEEFAQGEQSTLREFLPYPEGVSEQQRDALHRIWLDKLSNARSKDFELVHVIPRLMAKALSMSMRIHHPFDAPQDIGPTPDAGAVRHHVVYWKDAYHRLEPVDPADPGLDSGFPQTVVPVNAKERLDALFNDVINRLEQRIATAGADLTSKRGRILQHVFHRNLAGIRQQPPSRRGGGGRPVSLRGQAQEISEYRRYLNSLHEDGGWQDESPELESSFTLRLTAGAHTNTKNRTSLHLNIGGNDVILNLGKLVAPGDRVSVDFGKVVDGQGVGIARFPYTEADGTESFIYRKLDREFEGAELEELRKRVPTRVWQFEKPGFVDSFRRAAKVGSSGHLSAHFGERDETGSFKRHSYIPRARAADGSSFSQADMANVVLEVGYDLDGRPLAVVEIPAERNRGRALYLQLTDPDPTAHDIERLRKAERAERTLEFDKPSFKDSFRVVTTVGERGILNVRFSQGDEEKATRRASIARAKFADGTPFVIPRGMAKVVLEVGYDLNDRPLAVAEIPAERNRGQALYLRLTDPAPAARDIEWQRKNAFWESWDQWSLDDAIVFHDNLIANAALPKPIDLRVGGPGKTVDGLEVNLSAGTAITLRVGKRRVGPGFVDNVFVVVKAPLKPLDDAAKTAYLEANSLYDVSQIPTHAYRLVNTGKTDAKFRELIEQLEARQERRERAAAGPAAKRRRTGGGLPGGPAAFEWAGAASGDAGVGSSSGWAAGVEPSVVRVDGGWRVSYRSAKGLPSWGEMTRVESDRFTWQGPAPLEFVPTPE